MAYFAFPKYFCKYIKAGRLPSNYPENCIFAHSDKIFKKMGYGNPPWDFKGQALYQLSLVKVEEVSNCDHPTSLLWVQRPPTFPSIPLVASSPQVLLSDPLSSHAQARKYVPADLPVVNFFGWTLGGFYLARYTESPVGPFDELVALAGLVWDFPTSCAWAARVYVNNKEARDHGISSVGLPSRLAGFKAIPLPALGSTNTKKKESAKLTTENKATWWDIAAPNKKNSTSSTKGKDATSYTPTFTMELLNLESRGKNGRGLTSPVCTINMPHVPSTWAPRIQMFLPSFSGATPAYPGLLKYSLRLLTHVRFLKPVGVRLPEERSIEDQSSGEVLDAVIGGKPLVCMAFDGMHMEVQPPEPWAPPQGKSLSVERMQGKTA